MPMPFRVESSNIKLLNDLQLTKLLKLLLHLEARSFGIAERTVEVALNINVGDGGEDGRIHWNGSPVNTDFLPCNLVQFQIKATKDMTPSGFAKDVLNKQGLLKSMVENVLDNNGAYIQFTIQELNTKQKNAIVKQIRTILRKQGKSYADTAIICIYDASTIEGWVNKYISATVAVLNWRGTPLERGLKTWEDWGQQTEYQRFSFVADKYRIDTLNNLRTLINSHRKCARIIGLSGMGKTRLAFEIFRDKSDTDDLSKRVVYLDAQAHSAVLGLISDWVQCGLEGIIVVDNCPISLHDKLRHEVNRSDSRLSLLTLDYDLERTSQTEIVHLKQLPDENIKQMLEPVYGKEIPDLDRVIGFAQGFPQMAVLLADARLDKEPEMGRLTDDQLAHKMLWGGRQPSEDDELILKGCALFDRFGIDDEVSNEYEFIASNIVGVDVNKFYDCVKRFEERGLIDRRGRFARLVPKPLAIRLAADWWRRTRQDKQVALIQSDMPGDLVKSFCEQISLLDFLPEVKTLTEDLCGHKGPFGQAEVILSNKGSHLFRALVEVNPDATSKALLNVLQKCSEEKLSQITGDVRRNLVWALEKLCFHKSCFEEAIKSLLLLASSENEKWSNNSTGIFEQLFRTFLSGTEAPPSMRLKLIDDALKSDRNTIRELAIKALEQAIDTDGSSRAIGAEYQGSGKPLEEWRPKVWGEAFEYWDQALDRLCKLVIVKDPLAPLAKRAVSNHIRGLMRNGRVDSLDKVIRKIVEQEGPFWPSALDNIKKSLRYEGNAMPDEGKTKLNEWVLLLTPVDLYERLNLIVSSPPYEHEKNEDGHYEDIAAKNAKRLAEELAKNMNSIAPYIEKLLDGEQRQAYIFGKYLVEAAGRWEPLVFEVINKIVGIENPNINFLMGILNGIYNLDNIAWQNIVKIFSDQENLNQYYIHAIVTGKVNTDQLDCLIELIRLDKIKPFLASSLTYGKPLEHLNYNDVTKFVKSLSYISDDAAWIAIDILSMYCYQNSENWQNCKTTFREIVTALRLYKSDKRGGHLEMYHWHDVVEKLLQSENEIFAIDVTKQILAINIDKIDYGDLWHYVQPIIRTILQKYAKDVWPLFSEAIKNAAPLEKFRFKHLLNPGSSFDKKKPSVLSDLPDDIFREWCRQNPDIVPEFVAQTTDVLLDIDDKYQISPRAQFLIDNFGDDEHVLSGLSANLSSFGWRGSAVPYLRKEIAALETLKNHKNANVRRWIRERLNYLAKMIERETIRDEERDWGIY